MNPTGLSDSTNDPTNPIDPSTVYFHCVKCKRVFLSLSQRRAHVRQDCCSPHTPFVCDTDHGHSPIEIDFSTMEEALAWRIDDQELDCYFSIRQSGKNYKVFNCSQKHEGKKQDKVKHSKKVLNCHAKFMFNQRRLCHCDTSTPLERCSSYKDVIQVRGCLEHSHPLERRNIHLSKKTKDGIVDLLKSGLQKSVILEKHFPPSREDPTSKPVTANDIHRLEKANNLQGYNSKASEVDNLTALMSGHSFRGFNYGRKFDMSHFSEDVQAKSVNTDGQFMICYASPEMIDRFKNHPFTVAIDGTHGTNASKFILISVNVIDSRGEGSPIFQCLVESENQKIFSSALRILKSLAPEACSQTRVLLTDLSHTFINSWREVINPEVIWSPCHWHLERSWARHIQNARILSEIKNLRRIANREDFLNEASKIKMKWETRDESSRKAIDYFWNNYGPEGRVAAWTSWARFATLGALSHNLSIERYHRTIKLKLKPNFNLVRFCLGLIQIDQFYLRKEIHAVEGIHGTGASKMQNDHQANHPLEIDDYCVDSTTDGFVITKTTENGGSQRSYHLAKNRFACNLSRCKVVCSKCPSPKVCAHVYTCDCAKFCYGNLCKHTHLLSMLKYIDPPFEENDETETLQQEEIDEKNPECGQDHAIVVERELDDEEIEFLDGAKKLEEKARNIREIMASKVICKDFKRALNINLQTMPLGDIVVNRNPASFPKIDRKRTHEPQIRSHFPAKKKTTISNAVVQNE